MPSVHTYTAKTISVHYPWPNGISGVERIMLTAQGDLQRLLSAFFDRPIVVSLVYSRVAVETSSPPTSPTSPRAPLTASPTTPIIQTRQVHLLCSNRTVCTATSTVRITSAECARLFLQEKYAIGQVFMEIGRVPRFELMDVGTGGSELWRKYKLEIDGFECDILEVFPDREMFRLGESWFDDKPSSKWAFFKEDFGWGLIMWFTLLLFVVTFWL